MTYLFFQYKLSASSTWHHGVLINLLCRFRKAMDQTPPSYVLAAAGGAASVMAVQDYTEVAVLTATNACEDALPRCRRSFLRARFTSAASLHFSSPCSRCKSRFKRERSLTTSSLLSMPMYITLVPFADVLEEKMRWDSCPIAGGVRHTEGPSDS